MAVFLDEDGYVDQRVCRFYLVSSCMSGNRCRFLHCKELLKTKITWLCLHFLNAGGCTFGANCKFDHPEWARGLSLLPKICGQYRHEKDGEKCPDPDCRHFHFTDEEHQAYIKDRIIPERYDWSKKNENRLVQYSSDEEEKMRVEGRSRDQSKDNSGRNHHNFRKDRTRSPRRERSPKREKSPKRPRSRSPMHPSSRNIKKEESPESEEKRIHKLKRTIKELRTELDDVWKEQKHVQRQLVDHKRFHDADQELINDLMRARNKLEEDINRLNGEKLEMTKQVSDLFSDNKVVVEENQRLRGLLQQAQDSRRTSTQTVTPISQTSYPDPFSTSGSSSSMFQQTSWNQ